MVVDLENWSQKLIALFVAALMDKFVNQETITLCIDGILCGLLGIISFLGISLIYKNNDDSYRIHWRLILAAFIFASLLGGALSNFLYPWLGWLGTVLVTLIIGATIQNLHKAFQFGVIKSLRFRKISEAFFVFPQISQMYTDFRPVRSWMTQILCCS